MEQEPQAGEVKNHRRTRPMGWEEKEALQTGGELKNGPISIEIWVKLVRRPGICLSDKELR